MIWKLESLDYVVVVAAAVVAEDEVVVVVEFVERVQTQLIY